MAGKRQSPLEDPPSASSTDEEEAGVESGDEGIEDGDRQHKQQEITSDDGEEEDGEEKSEEDEPEPTPVVSSQKKPTLQSPQPKPSDSHESDYSGADDDSDSLRSLKAPGASDFIIKPNASKSMDSVSHQKASGKTAVVPASSSKQAAKSGKEPNEKEKALMAAEGDESNKAVASEKKPGVTRIWSEADELALLKGMIEFESKKGTDPFSDPHKFYEFIKKSKSLQVDVSEKQMIEKIKRLKKKCNDNIAKFSNGEDPVFSKPHDYRVFDLSKKIWKGRNVKSKNSKKSATPSRGDANPAYPQCGSKSSKDKKNVPKNSNPMVVSLSKDGVKSKSTMLKETLEINGAFSNEDEDVKMENSEVKHRKRGAAEMYPFIYETMQSMDGMNFLKGLDFSMIDKSKLEDLEQKFKKHKLAETELYLRKMESVKEMCKLMITAMK